MNKFLKKFDIWLCLHWPVMLGRRSWHELWIREDEFHPSLDLDLRIMMSLGKGDLHIYRENNRERRDKAHKRDLTREDAKDSLPAIH